jgi:PAS domain S-box-containing protein/putative nucleotidyltransferase with HDIG domain
MATTRSKRQRPTEKAAKVLSAGTRAKPLKRNQTKTKVLEDREYRLLVEMANSIILSLDMTGTIILANDFALRVFGFSKKDLVGKNVLETILPKKESSGRDLSKLIESIRHNPAQFLINENENLCKDGKKIWILWTNRAVTDQQGVPTRILCIGNDITARRQAEETLQRSQKELEEKVQERTAELEKAHEELLFEMAERKVNEEALRESEIKYRSIVEGALEGIFQTTAEGQVIFINGALVRMLGYNSAEEIISASSKMENRFYVHPERSLEIKKLLKKNGSVLGFETQFYKKNRNKIWVSLNVRAVYDERGNFLFYEGTVLDITAKQILDGTTRALSMAIELRDPYTAGHQLRVTKLASAIAEELGLTKDQRSAIHTAGILHDIGKIYVPAEFLSKPGRVSQHELSILRDHSQAGFEILKDIEFEHPVAEIVLQHHERLDGSGYPRGLSGEAILLEARIISVADVVESMGSHRPYRPSLGMKKALDEIQEYKGVRYDAQAVEACLELFQEKGFGFEG